MPDDLVYDPEAQRYTRRVPPYMSAERPAAAPAAAPAPDVLPPSYRTDETLPSTSAQPSRRFGSTIESQQQTLTPTTTSQLPSDQIKQRMSDLWTEIHPHPQTRLGKFGHVMNVIGQDVGMALEPEMMTNIPGTFASKRAELAGLQKELGPQLEREAHAEREKELTGIERGKLELEGLPKLLTGTMDYRTPKGGGPPERAYNVRGQVLWAPEGAAPPTGAPTTLPSTRDVTPAEPAQGDQGYVYGAPKEQTAEEKLHSDFLAAAQVPEAKRNAQQAQIFGENVGRWGKEIPVTPQIIDETTKRMEAAHADAIKHLGPDAPPPPKILPTDSMEKADEKEHRYGTDIYNKLEGRRKDLENLPGKTASLELKQMQIQEKQRAEAMEAQVSYGNLYAQENYRNQILAWQKSPSYVKDLGLVNSVVNEAKAGNLAGPGMGVSVGALLGGAIGGPAGAVIGAGAGTAVNVLQTAISGPVNGYLEALKKNGISNEGYQAMQAYFNALPGRMAYELSVQGLKASTMRSSQLLQKVMQTIPSPDTPREVFPKAFDQYYRPMKVLTDRKYLGRAGFAPPPITDFYPAETPAGGAPGGGNALPPGARIRTINPDGTVKP